MSGERSALLMVGCAAPRLRHQEVGERQQPGAPVTETLADKIGADGWAIDASRTVAVAKELA